ncbi:hypothetical protein G9A89_001015 [Geosiphon pyriformis]|nr:hypothetical protein G9A89_001015 [Geosiphon pyriformis]
MSMVIYELYTGRVPFCERAFDNYLALDICKGVRPTLPYHIPKCLAEIITQCWDPDPTNRPNAKDLNKSVMSFQTSDYNAFKKADKQRLKKHVSENVFTSMCTSKLLEVQDDLYISALKTLVFFLSDDE